MNGARRFAAIDVGTNSVLLTLAERGDPGQFVVISQFAKVTRLGQKVDKSGKLHPDAKARTLACLREYKELMSAQGITRGQAVGTSALRDAQGSRDFLENARDILGFDIEIISGETEARLTFQGALHGLSTKGPTFVFDIGGGSTELIVGNADDGSIQGCESLDLGCVRLTERFALESPPTQAQIDSLRNAVRHALSESKLSLPDQVQVIAVAGTVTTLSAIDKKMQHYDPEKVHASTLTADAVSQMARRLSTLSTEGLREVPGLSPGRADVIFAGALLCEEILRFARASSLIVSDRGVRFALLQRLNDETQALPLPTSS